jgi:hypothetical protein
MGLWRPSHEDTPMTSRSARTLSLWIAVVVTGGPVHAGQERSVGDNQPWQIAGLIPESEPGPLEKQAKPVTPENPIPRRSLIVRPSYPSEAAVVGARATISLRVTVDHLGTSLKFGPSVVQSSEPWRRRVHPTMRAFTAGLLALVQSAKDAVRHWLYEPPAEAPIAFTVVIGFSTQEHGEVISQNASTARGGSA